MIAVGLVPHTGWAWLVRVGGRADRPEVERREKIVACEVLDGELYHLAAERKRERESFLETRRRQALARARAALTGPLDGVRAAVVVGKKMAARPLEQILAAHPLIHGAEGELWRELFVEAAVAHGVAATRASADELRAALVERWGEPAVARFLSDSKRVVGAPFGREPQAAALAAWSALT